MEVTTPRSSDMEILDQSFNPNHSNKVILHNTPKKLHEMGGVPETNQTGEE